MKPSVKKGLWIALFVAVLGLLGTLATSWNYILVDHYDQVSKIVSELRVRSIKADAPWINGILGTLGFLAVCGALYFFLQGLLREIRANQIQSEFLARVTHELKTPLSTIELVSSLLKEKHKVQSDDDKKLWELFDRELLRLKSDVASLLSAARGQVDGFKAQLRVVYLEDWISTHFPVWQSLLGSDCVLSREGTKLNLNILADEKLLGLIFENLLTNAKKFSKPGSKIVLQTHILSPVKSQVSWSVSVIDSGTGFKNKDRKKIFKRFVRLPQRTLNTIAGTGLGLYLVKQACRAQKMRISAESPGLGLGAKFTVTGRGVLVGDNKLEWVHEQNRAASLGLS